VLLAIVVVDIFDLSTDKNENWRILSALVPFVLLLLLPLVKYRNAAEFALSLPSRTALAAAPLVNEAAEAAFKEAQQVGRRKKLVISIDNNNTDTSSNEFIQF
jgi:hypothetical protein